MLLGLSSYLEALAVAIDEPIQCMCVHKNHRNIVYFQIFQKLMLFSYFNKFFDFSIFFFFLSLDLCNERDRLHVFSVRM